MYGYSGGELVNFKLRKVRSGIIDNEEEERPIVIVSEIVAKGVTFLSMLYPSLHPKNGDKVLHAGGFEHLADKWMDLELTKQDASI